MSRVYVVILNWNGWGDTLECLESLYRSDYEFFRVIVCDNASSDNSIEMIRKWADGDLCARPTSQRNEIRRLSIPPVPKPLRMTVLDAWTSIHQRRPWGEQPDIVLIRNQANLGFAGGNNVGIRYALYASDFDYLWLLNNDTVVEKEALRNAVHQIKTNEGVGMVGSKVIYYKYPERLQAAGGGTYNRWFGTQRLVGAGRKPDAHVSPPRLDFILGAALLVSRPFLARVGLMSERYFLYFEEIDWSTRARGIFRLSYAADSIVFHKEGASAGTSTNSLARSNRSDFYGLRNRLLFTSTFFPYALPSVYLGAIGTIVNRMRRGQWKRALLLLVLLFRPFTSRAPE